MYQKFMAIGRLGKDPELRYTSTEGVAVCSFNIAVDRYVNGEKETDWFRIVTWRKLAENCANFLTKGKLVFVEGRLQIRQYEDNEGQKRTAVEVVANNVIFLSPKDNGEILDNEGDGDVPF